MGPKSDRLLAQLRRRIAELQGEIAEAEKNNDAAQLMIFRNEMEEVQEALTDATNLFGKPRSFNTPREKARKAVSKTLRQAIKALEEYHPGLAEHLSERLTPITYPLSYFPQNLSAPDIHWNT